MVGWGKDSHDSALAFLKAAQRGSAWRHADSGRYDGRGRLGANARPICQEENRSGTRWASGTSGRTRRVVGRLFVGLSLATFVASSFPAWGVARALSAEGADLSLKASWIGNGPPNARRGETFGLAVTVTNLGPGTAVGVVLSTNESDQFNFASATCSDPSLCAQPGIPPPGGIELPPQATATGTFRWTVASVDRGESRTAGVTIRVEATTPDPNPDDNAVDTIIRIVGSDRSDGPGPTFAHLIDLGDRDLIRAWAAERSIAQIDRAVAGLSVDRRNRLAEVLLDSNATGVVRQRLLSIMRTILAQRDLGFYAEIWSYTRIEMTPGGFFGTCRMLFLDAPAYAGLLDFDARNVLAHESLHSFNCVNGGPTGSLDEGSALWVIKAGFREPLGVGESWAEATYGSKLFFRDILGDPNLPLEAPANPTRKLLDVYQWLADNDPSRLPWNSTERLVTCFEHYFEGLDRNVDFVTDWLPAVQEATDSMLADPACRPI
jgi:hypothetical protein